MSIPIRNETKIFVRWFTEVGQFTKISAEMKPNEILARPKRNETKFWPDQNGTKFQNFAHNIGRNETKWNFDQTETKGNFDQTKLKLIFIILHTNETKYWSLDKKYSNRPINILVRKTETVSPWLWCHVVTWMNPRLQLLSKNILTHLDI